MYGTGHRAARTRQESVMAGKKPASKSAAKARKPAPKPSAKAAPVAKAAAKVAPAKPTVAAKSAAPKAAPAAAHRSAASRAVESPAVTIKAAPAAPAPKTKAAPAAPIARALRKSPLAEPNPANADSGEDVSSLLAGPRNVTPYVAKRGERYMNAEQLRHFQEILLSWKRDLMVEVDRTVTHMKDEAANFPDPNDRATQEEEFSLELRTRDRERKLIRKIDEALARIDDGSYGYCLETGEEIGIKRLEARPVATLTIEAQERRERRERQYGDRDDRYR
jgi:DnaK suppressor protein